MSTAILMMMILSRDHLTCTWNSNPQLCLKTSISTRCLNTQLLMISWEVSTLISHRTCKSKRILKPRLWRVFFLARALSLRKSRVDPDFSSLEMLSLRVLAMKILLIKLCRTCSKEECVLNNQSSSVENRRKLKKQEMMMSTWKMKKAFRELTLLNSRPRSKKTKVWSKWMTSICSKQLLTHLILKLSLRFKDLKKKLRLKRILSRQSTSLSMHSLRRILWRLANDYFVWLC